MLKRRSALTDQLAKDFRLSNINVCFILNGRFEFLIAFDVGVLDKEFISDIAVEAAANLGSQCPKESSSRPASDLRLLLLPRWGRSRPGPQCYWNPSLKGGWVSYTI